MKEILIPLMNVEEDGLPEPDSGKEYVVITSFGMGYGTYDKEIKFDENGWHHTGKYKWYLDFDAFGKDVIAYFEVKDEFFK